MHSNRSTMCAVGRAVWWSITPLTGAVGIAASYVVLGTGSATLLAGLGGFLAAFTGWTLTTQVPDPPPLPPLPLAVLSAGTLLAAVGLLLALGPFGLAICVTTALTGWGVLRPGGRSPGASGDRPRVAPPPARSTAWSHEVPLPPVAALRTLGTPELCRVWRLTYPRLARAATVTDTERLTDLRRGCLAELEQRDPVAFGRWLPTARAASDPARFFCPRAVQDGAP
jgi:hypothetical protein